MLIIKYRFIGILAHRHGTLGSAIAQRRTLTSIDAGLLLAINIGGKWRMGDIYGWRFNSYSLLVRPTLTFFDLAWRSGERRIGGWQGAIVASHHR